MEFLSACRGNCVRPPASGSEKAKDFCSSTSVRRENTYHPAITMIVRTTATAQYNQIQLETTWPSSLGPKLKKLVLKKV
jgi:hypothetical protein